VGTWGVALYANDTALDVRDEWLDKLRLGTSGDAATAELLAEWGAAATDPIFWIALADTQWTWGRLEARVRDRAQAAIDAGGDLALWADRKEKGARKKVFDEIAARLKTEAPAPKAVSVRGDAIEWKRGQVWAYRTLDGRWAAFRVCAFDEACGLVGAPVVELLDVALDEPPAAGVAAAAKAGLRAARAGYNDSGRFDFYEPQFRASPVFEPKVKRKGELPRHRLKRLRGASEAGPATATTKTIAVPWDALDEFLPNMFDLGGPRLGAVHAWGVAGGDTAYTVVESMRWQETDIATQWQLGVLECRGPDRSAAELEGAKVVTSFIVHGFPPAGTLREAAYRPPKAPDYVSGTVHKWESVPRLVEDPSKLVKAADAMKKFLEAAAAARAKKK
jgi:hypothetical protein